jgi:Icc-related predicted phosphoesterase
MKIQIVSDLHLEFNKDLTVNNAGADILILSGDICVADHLYSNPTAGITDMIQKGWHADDARRYRHFFDHVSKQFDTVFYVMGNHEHYHGRWDRTASSLRETLEPYINIHLLDNEWINIDGVRFAGTTLWTDLNRRDPITMHAVKDMMNDYRTITKKTNETYHKLRPIDTVLANDQAVEFLKLAYETWSGPVVVVGHHCPSMLSCHPTYKGDFIMNGAFYNNLDEFIESCDRIKLWTHGHTHRACDYSIGNTRIVCNPHGYPSEVKEYNPSLVVEI